METQEYEADRVLCAAAQASDTVDIFVGSALSTVTAFTPRESLIEQLLDSQVPHLSCACCSFILYGPWTIPESLYLLSHAMHIVVMAHAWLRLGASKAIAALPTLTPRGRWWPAHEQNAMHIYA
jgi:hypothetical protein